MLASLDLRHLLCFAVLVASSACEHAEGGPCQVDGDCEDGLVCLLHDENRGTCKLPADADAGSNQAPEGDAGPLNPDATPPGDSGAAGASGAPDSGADSDAGADADGG